MTETWIPEPSDATRPFFDGAIEGRLTLQCCNQCQTWAFPLATICSNCGSSEIVWRDASGKGVLYAHARLARVYHPRHEQRLPLVLAQVDISEGVRLMTNLVDVEPGDVVTGMKVTVAFEKFEDGGGSTGVQT